MVVETYHIIGGTVEFARSVFDSLLNAKFGKYPDQGCIFRLTCSHRELTKDYVLTSAYVKIFRTVMKNAVNRGV